MAGVRALQKAALPVPELLRCPRCRQHLREPVTATCGHSLCRRCVPGPGTVCPVCREPLPAAGLRVNVLLNGLLERYRAAEGSPGPSTTRCLCHPPRATQDALQPHDPGSPDTQSPDSRATETWSCHDMQNSVEEPQDSQSQESAAGGEWIVNSRANAQEAHQTLDELGIPARFENSSVETTGSLQDILSGLCVMGNQTVEEPASNQLAGGLSNSAGSDWEKVTESSLSLCPLPPELSVSDFDCSLCTRLLFEPVTTPCGHTFCRKCMQRSLDYRPSCALCKEDLRKFLEQRPYRVTHALHSFITGCFSTESAERRQLNLMEMSELSELMMRRCQETGTRMFGMCQFQADKGFSDYGCMLKIQRSEDLPDGRSLIDTVGGRRFKVLRRSQRDGYNAADIEYLQDKQIEGEELSDIQHFHDQVYRKAQSWYDHLPYFFKQHICSYHGPIPGPDEDLQALVDGPRWCWWFLAIVPIQPTLQTLMLSTTSLNDRLLQLQRILKYLRLNSCSD